MAAGCPAKCAKFLLIVFNIIFWLCGAALLAVGIWLLVDSSIVEKFDIISVEANDKWLTYAAYALVAVGAFVFITGFAGCCGAIKESPCLLGIYIFLLVLVMLIEIAAGVLGFIFKGKIDELITKNMLDAFKSQNYTAGQDDQNKIIYTGLGSTMNFFQTEYKCCGIKGPSDYDVMTNQDDFSADGRPKTCYPEEDPNKSIYDKGCKDGVSQWFEEKAFILIGLAIGIACLEIFGVIFAVCVCRNPSVDYE